MLSTEVMSTLSLTANKKYDCRLLFYKAAIIKPLRDCLVTLLKVSSSPGVTLTMAEPPAPARY